MRIASIKSFLLISLFNNNCIQQNKIENYSRLVDLLMTTKQIMSNIQRHVLPVERLWFV